MQLQRQMQSQPVPSVTPTFVPALNNMKQPQTQCYTVSPPPDPTTLGFVQQHPSGSIYNQVFFCNKNERFTYFNLYL